MELQESSIHIGCREWLWQRWLLDRLPWLGTPELLQRIAVTFIFLGILRGMSFVPLPYLDMQAVPDTLMTGMLSALLTALLICVAAYISYTVSSVSHLHPPDAGQCT